MAQQHRTDLASLIAWRIGANLDVARLDEHALKRTHRRVVSQFPVAAENDLLNLVGGGIEFEAGKSPNVLTVLTNVGSKEQFHLVPPSSRPARKRLSAARAGGSVRTVLSCPSKAVSVFCTACA